MSRSKEKRGRREQQAVLVGARIEERLCCSIEQDGISIEPSRSVALNLNPARHSTTQHGAIQQSSMSTERNRKDDGSHCRAQRHCFATTAFTASTRYRTSTQDPSKIPKADVQCSAGTSNSN